MGLSDIVPYNRQSALAYARQWALGRNPAYLDFTNIGGDCTNFVSQVLYAGQSIMNYSPTFGWFYINGNRKSPSWTGVPFLHDFLVSNQGTGPFALETDYHELEPGDVIQYGFYQKGSFQHSVIVTDIKKPAALDRVFFASHDTNFLDQKLTYYDWVDIRFLHIMGSRR
jgi:hypothetical protein